MYNNYAIHFGTDRMSRNDHASREPNALRGTPATPFMFAWIDDDLLIVPQLLITQDAFTA